MNNHFDWSRFVVRINIDAPAQKLYSSWATSEGMEFWFLRLCEYTTKGGKLLAQPDAANQGDRYKFLWHGWPDETVEFGEILEANGTDRFKFSFGKAGHCTVRILSSGKEHILRIPVEPGLLRKGGNEIQLTSLDGSWIVFDQVRLEGPSTVKLNAPENIFIREAKAADYEIAQDGKRFQPLTIREGIRIEQSQPLAICY